MNKATEETMGGVRERSVASGMQWLPGDRVWYRDKSSLDTAWDQPVLMTVVLEKDGLVWIEDGLEDKLVFSHELSPYTKEDEEKKTTLATLYALLNQTTLIKEEVGEVCSVLIEAGITFNKEKRDDIG